MVLDSVEVGVFSAGFAELEDALDLAAHAFLARAHRKGPHRSMVRTPPFHGGNTGSNPVGDTKFDSAVWKSCNALKAELLGAIQMHCRCHTLNRWERAPAGDAGSFAMESVDGSILPAAIIHAAASIGSCGEKYRF